jgi:hypothetical protein
MALTSAIALSSAAQADERRMEGGQVYSGFALELHLGSQFLNLTGGGTSLTVGALSGGFMAGYKISRFIFGLGFELSRVASGMSTPTASSSTAATGILFVPGLRVAIYRTPDGRVDLFGQFDMGFGTTVEERSPGVATDESDFRLTYDIGPGVRYWVHPQFAFAALTGVAGNFTWISTGTGTTAMTNSTGVTSIFATLQILGVF